MSSLWPVGDSAFFQPSVISRSISLDLHKCTATFNVVIMYFIKPNKRRIVVKRYVINCPLTGRQCKQRVHLI